MPGDVVVVRGTGSIGRRHLRAFAAQPGVTAVAFPVRPERAGVLRADGIVAITDPADLPAPPVAVVIATDTARHVADASELLPFGDLLVEKPLAATTAGLDGLARLAREHGRQIWVAFCLRFDPSLQRFAALLPSIGTVDSVRIECQSYLPEWRPQDDYRRSYSARADEGGVLRDLSHEIDYATTLFGRPDHVYAALSRGGRLEIESEEAADLLWSVPAGPAVSVRLDYLSRVPRRRMRAVGAEGELEWDALAQSVTLRKPGAADITEPVPCPRDEMFQRQAAAFLGACRGTVSPALATFEQGAFVAALTDAAHRSSLSRQAERIDVIYA